MCVSRWVWVLVDVGGGMGCVFVGLVVWCMLLFVRRRNLSPDGEAGCFLECLLSLGMPSPQVQFQRCKILTPHI
jgi:hypothetical protein